MSAVMLIRDKHKYMINPSLNRKHVLFTERVSGNSAWSLIDSIAELLISKGNAVTYCKWDDGSSVPELTIPQGVVVKTISVSGKRKPWDVWKQESNFSREFVVFLDKVKPDIVHTGFCLPGNVARRIAGRQPSIKVVTTYHELFGSLNFYLKWVSRRTEKYVDRQCYISQTVAR